MKSKIFGVLALISVVVAGIFFGMFSGTWMAYIGFMMLFMAMCFACGCIESLSNYRELSERIINLMPED